MVNNTFAYVMLPTAVMIAIVVSVFCNFAVVRMKGTLVKLALFNFSAVTLSVVYTVFYINSAVFKLRTKALNKRKEMKGLSELEKRVLNGCRVYRMVLGVFCDIDFALLMASMTVVIDYTASLLIAF